MVVSAANSAARKRPRTPDQGPRAVEDQAVQAAPRPGGPGSGNSDEHGSELRSDADGGLTAVELDAVDLDTDADLESFEDLDADDADLQAALAGGDLEEADVIVDVAEVVEELAGDDVEVPEGPDAAEEPDQPSAEADAEAEAPVRQAPASSRSPRTAAVRTRRSSSSVTTTMIFRPRRSRWRVPPRIRSRTT